MILGVGSSRVAYEDENDSNVAVKIPLESKEKQAAIQSEVEYRNFKTSETSPLYKDKLFAKVYSANSDFTELKVEKLRHFKSNNDFNEILKKELLDFGIINNEIYLKYCLDGNALTVGQLLFWSVDPVLCSFKEFLLENMNKNGIQLQYVWSDNFLKFAMKEMADETKKVYGKYANVVFQKVDALNIFGKLLLAFESEHCKTKLHGVNELENYSDRCYNDISNAGFPLISTICRLMWFSLMVPESVVFGDLWHEGQWGL